MLPLTLCIKTLYRVFPEIKAVGCCHEVFGTQWFLRTVVEDIFGFTGLDRRDIKVNPIGVNHFTWLTSAICRGKDMYPAYAEFCKKYPHGYALDGKPNENWKTDTLLNSARASGILKIPNALLKCTLG